jgi:hypothetical protein
MNHISNERLPIPIPASNTGNSGTGLENLPNGIVKVENGIAGNLTVGTNLQIDNNVLKTVSKPAFAQISDTTMGDQTMLMIGNVAVGTDALNETMSGFGGNTAIGDSALKNITYGGANTAIGAHSLIGNLSGFRNTSVGARSLELTNGADNTAIGVLAGGADIAGTSNTFVGQGACGDIMYGYFSGSFCNYLGNNTRFSSNMPSNETVLTANTTGKGSNTAIIKASNGLYFNPVVLTQLSFSGAFNTPTYINENIPFPLTLGINATNNVDIMPYFPLGQIRLFKEGYYKLTFTGYFTTSTPAEIQIKLICQNTYGFSQLTSFGVDTGFKGTISFPFIIIHTTGIMGIPIYTYTTNEFNPSISIDININVIIEYLGSF